MLPAEYVNNNRILAEFVASLPHYPYCSDSKGFPVIRSKSVAQNMPYIGVNYPLINYLIFDLDYDTLLNEFYLTDLPPPTLRASDKITGNAHSYYQLQRPIPSNNMSDRTRKFLDVVLLGMCQNLQADTYMLKSNQLSKNPLFDGWSVTITNYKYNLNELVSYVSNDLVEIRQNRRVNNLQQSSDTFEAAYLQNPHSRNCCLFDYGRFIGYELTKEGYDSEQVYANLLNAFTALNDAKLPGFYPKGSLLYSELRCIARSIANYCKNHRQKVLEMTKNRGIMGLPTIHGLDRTEYEDEVRKRQAMGAGYTHKVRKKQTETKLRKVVDQCIQEGVKPTLGIIAIRSGMSVRTVKYHSDFIKNVL